MADLVRYEREEEADPDEPIDASNYKGIYFHDDPGSKFQCPVTGAHFEYQDMVRRLRRLQKLRHAVEKLE